MASYTADPGEVAVTGRTLVAGVEDIVDLNGDSSWLEVVYWAGSGTTPIYVRANSGTSAVSLPAGDGGSTGYEVFPGDRVKFDVTGLASRARLICAEAAKYSISEA